MTADDFDTSTVHDVGTRDGGVESAKSDQYKARVEELSGMVDGSTIAGGRSFAELTLYEKKSVLINQELE